MTNKLLLILEQKPANPSSCLSRPVPHVRCGDAHLSASSGCTSHRLDLISSADGQRCGASYFVVRCGNVQVSQRDQKHFLIIYFHFGISVGLFFYTFIYIYKGYMGHILSLNLPNIVVAHQNAYKSGLYRRGTLTQFG